MKKFIYGLAFAATLIACNKVKNQPASNKQSAPVFTEQKLTPIETEKISIENGILAFESIGFFQSIADFEDYSKVAYTVKYLNSLNFNSFGKIHPDDKLFHDEFIGAIINKDQVVKIGDWLIRINPTSNKVFAISSRVENAYNLLVNETETNHAISTFSTTESVLEVLSGNGENQTKCGEDGVAEREDYCYYVPWGESNSNRCFLRHKKFGIYFKIQTECTSPMPPNQYFWITYSVKQYKKKCDNMVTMTPGTTWSPLTQSGGWNDVLTQGTTNYNKYWVRITAAGHCTFNIYTGVNSYDANINCILEIKANM